MGNVWVHFARVAFPSKSTKSGKYITLLYLLVHSFNPRGFWFLSPWLLGTFICCIFLRQHVKRKLFFFMSSLFALFITSICRWCGGGVGSSREFRQNVFSYVFTVSLLFWNLFAIIAVETLPLQEWWSRSEKVFDIIIASMDACHYLLLLLLGWRGGCLGEIGPNIFLRHHLDPF